MEVPLQYHTKHVDPLYLLCISQGLAILLLTHGQTIFSLKSFQARRSEWTTQLAYVFLSTLLPKIENCKMITLGMSLRKKI